ncbi:MAG TPA: alpha-N-acetylglucosaminidase TIM-barrel domain-containing protein [Bryobacteraceae bacterium]|nr:alpha-N-acetylglucosaminidase TIM-barrel domain-containing protein [Bryobacteraceae bacterium]
MGALPFSAGLAVAALLGAVHARAAQPLTVVTPLRAEKAYEIAGETFADMWQQVTGARPAVATYIQPFLTSPPAGDLCLIGSDSVNPLVHQLIRQGNVRSLSIEYGGDGYRLLSLTDGKRKILIVAGGSGRSTIYAVYDFFRQRAGAEYFWDGDVIPRRASLDIDGLDIVEKPRFEYRGLRYFAHRGLHRFQAEHWDMNDWKREIDWLLKKRFNLFMLRTGIDDLFQRAFPGEVPYPPEDRKDPDGVDRSYNDRTSFWPLKYRGELRKKVLEYAADRGLLHPEDTGTMTHWYSHTPSALYRSRPDFPLISDQRTGYQLPTHAIWDIEKQESWDLYWRLTQTHIDQYSGRAPRLFHTIGMAERTFGASDEDNLQRKLYVYRRTQQTLRQKYPDAPLLIASWDLYGWWKDGDVSRLLNEFDPSRTMILEYTADVKGRSAYKDWNLFGRFPWIFGIFHGFAWNSDIHEDYADLAPRILEAAKDDKCRGLVALSEISHNDTFMLEYLADNAWRPERVTANAALDRYVTSRYPDPLRQNMNAAWKAFLPASQALHWVQRGPGALSFGDPQFRVLTNPAFIDLTPQRLEHLRTEYARIRPLLTGAPTALNVLSDMAPQSYENELWRRDAIDMARTLANRGLLLSLMDSALELERWRLGKGQQAKIRRLSETSVNLMEALAAVLEHSAEFSMRASLDRLRQAEPINGVEARVNGHSELTLKSNAENNYCRSHHFEMVRHLYAPELRSYWQYVMKRIEAGDRTEWKRPAEFTGLSEEHRNRFYETPLKRMAPAHQASGPLLAESLKKLAALLAQL